MSNDVEELVVVLATAAVALVVISMYLDGRPSPRRYSLKSGAHIRTMLQENPFLFRRVYRMRPWVFNNLCKILRSKALLRDTRDISVEEQLAMFLIAVGQGQRYSETMERFDRSVWTVSTYFNRVLDAVLQLKNDFIQPPSTDVPSKILESNKYHPYFKDCIGVIDGTYIKAHIVGDDSLRFWNRKSFVSQNVMAACNFDMEFTYILAGWEGSATDLRVMHDALNREEKLLVPEGKYYLVDAGYTNLPGFLAPYYGTRWHLNEYDSRYPPQNERELFNYRHSLLWSTIEQTFRALKRRFTILNMAPPYPYETQAKLVVACCVLHNYIRMVDPSDVWDEAYPMDVVGADAEVDITDDHSMHEQLHMAGIFRDSLASQMAEDVLAGQVELI
ncbi:hypothetical protein H6P81_015278 [Aristolochia fimbriata]|uniref:DDE Tnp4 domain-containing protein n=1 Tax=Aristolochia fimbriata TaxID=158543 RepID=A0AAV7E5N7_ARIFI|nr:hypothetical protein H6P81_015278 [Aristolochia fimbriata]